jgi:excisionase family DNA binding protein
MRRYTVNEAADELGVSRGLLYVLCQRRVIRHERHGLGRGKILIPADALDEYRRGVTVGAAASVPPPAPKTRLKHLHL